MACLLRVLESYCVLRVKQKCHTVLGLFIKGGVSFFIHRKKITTSEELDLNLLVHLQCS